MLPYSKIAAQIKEAREDLGLSQREVAKLAGVCQSTVSSFENGTRKRMDHQCLMAIASALNVNL